MFSNYLKVAVRNLLKHKLYTLINVGGLSVGLACAILISLWVGDELSFDRFHKNVENLYRVNWDFKWAGNEGVGPGTPPPLAATLASNIPDVAAATRLRHMPSATIRCGDRFFSEQGILAADSNFFDLFSFPLLDGDRRNVLTHP
ncbi:MAG TPA: ABC transporter permease, partial [Bacteroidota bacterium]|nr:ABC transporter permease [Bacteroidota bacterium]